MGDAYLQKRVKQLEGWVDDLQSGMYVNCVYCGYRYGPRDKVPTSMADALKIHIEKCPDHPMSKLKARVDELEDDVEMYRNNWLAARRELRERMVETRSESRTEKACDVLIRLISRCKENDFKSYNVSFVRDKSKKLYVFKVVIDGFEREMALTDHAIESGFDLTGWADLIFDETLSEMGLQDGNGEDSSSC